MHSREEKIKAFEDLLDVMDALREKCPWNAAQTMESIRPMTEEEVYELSDAIVRNDSQEIAKELGALLYHIVFYAKIAEEKEEFDVVCKQYGLDLISLIAPTSYERIAMIAKEAEGFLYIVSRKSKVPGEGPCSRRKRIWKTF